MILFYNKKTGNIFGTIDGRVHNEKQLNNYIVDKSIEEKEIGKFVIGWIQKGGKQIGQNLDQFKTLEKFESISPVSPLDYKIENGKLLLNK